MSIEEIGLMVGGAIIIIETIVLFMLVHHLKKLNEHTQKLDSHVEKLDVCYEQLHEHSHHLEQNVERLCSCILPEGGGDGAEARVETEKGSVG
jgi:hypothetical protein